MLSILFRLYCACCNNSN